MMAAAANAQRVETESFNKVLVNVPARVRIVPGDTYSVNVATTDSVLANSLRIDVEDGTLKINRDARQEALESDTTLRLIIVTPVEPAVLAGRDYLARPICNTYANDKNAVASSK